MRQPVLNVEQLKAVGVEEMNRYRVTQRMRVAGVLGQPGGASIAAEEVVDRRAADALRGALATGEKVRVRGLLQLREVLPDEPSRAPGDRIKAGKSSLQTGNPDAIAGEMSRAIDKSRF